MSRQIRVSDTHYDTLKSLAHTGRHTLTAATELALEIGLDALRTPQPSTPVPSPYPREHIKFVDHSSQKHPKSGPDPHIPGELTYEPETS